MDGRATRLNKGGRPKGSISETARIALELKKMMAQKLQERFAPIMDAQMDTALGIQTEAYNKSTNQLYYKDPGPNVLAFKNILEQVIGRPTENIQLGGNITFIIDI